MKKETCEVCSYYRENDICKAGGKERDIQDIDECNKYNELRKIKKE